MDVSLGTVYSDLKHLLCVLEFAAVGNKNREKNTTFSPKVLLQWSLSLTSVQCLSRMFNYCI